MNNGNKREKEMCQVNCSQRVNQKKRKLSSLFRGFKQLTRAQRNCIDDGQKSPKQTEVSPSERIRIQDPKKTWPRKATDVKNIAKPPWGPHFKYWSSFTKWLQEIWTDLRGQDLKNEHQILNTL